VRVITRPRPRTGGPVHAAEAPDRARSVVPVGVVALLAAFAPVGARADDWRNSLTPYLWASGMSGTTAVGTPLGLLEADVDLSFGDILSNLKIGGMLSYRGDGERWSVMADAIYMDLGADKATSAGPVTVDAIVSVKQTALEADVGYRVAERVLAFAGLRYNDINADLSVVRTGPGAGESRGAGGSESWTDPLIGVLGQIPLSARWMLELRGDIGGFGIGSDFAWQAMATARWRASKAIDVIGSYRYFKMSYEKDSGTSPFKYDMAISGPALGVTFRF
jgi:hypothetical protein